MAEANQNSSPVLPSLMDSNQTKPWLLISSGDGLQNHTFYSISKNKLIKRNISEFDNKQISSTSYHGWLALMEDRTSRLDCCLLNTTTREKIQLPSICMSVWFYRCIISTLPTDPNCQVLFLPKMRYDPILYCRLGDEKFVKGSTNIGSKSFFALTNFEGKFYGWMDMSYKIVEVGFVEGDIVINELVNSTGGPLMIPFPVQKGFFKSYMVDCCGELMLVFMICYSHSRETAYFKIFKINVLEKEVSELKSIGDRMIFLGPQDCTSKLCDPGESNLKRNSIYYICKDKFLYRYDIEDRSRTLVKLCPIQRRRECVMSWIA